MRIDDTRPIWIQLAEIFRARITDGTWKPGQKIPSVRDRSACPRRPRRGRPHRPQTDRRPLRRH